MKIATFNLKNFFEAGHTFAFYSSDVAYTSEFLERKIRGAAKTIRKIDPDILFLQEVASESLLERLASLAGPRYTYFLGKPDVRGISNAVVYRVPNCSCSSESIAGPLPVFTEGDADVLGVRISATPRREFVRLVTEYHGAPFILLGLHLKASSGIALKDAHGKFVSTGTPSDATDGLIRSAFVRLSQAKRVRSVVDSIFHAEGDDAQVAVLGDFNAPDDVDVVRIVKGELREHPAYLTDACERVPERKRFSHIKRGRKRLIDHILVSRRIEQGIRSVAIMNRGLRDQSVDELEYKAIQSDHAPVVAVLKD